MIRLQPYQVTLDMRGGSLRVRYQVNIEGEKFTGTLGTGEVMAGDSPELRKAVDALVAAVTHQINEMVGGPTADEEENGEAETPPDEGTLEL